MHIVIVYAITHNRTVKKISNIPLLALAVLIVIDLAHPVIAFTQISNHLYTVN